MMQCVMDNPYVNARTRSRSSWLTAGSMLASSMPTSAMK